VLVSVVIPAYNAGGFVGSRLPVLLEFLEARQLDHEVVVVDDGSTDDTQAAVRSAASKAVRVVGLPQNRGKFGALAAGMADTRGQVCVFMDADIPYDLRVVPHMLQAILEGGFHIVVGDRTLDGSTYAESLPPLRQAATRLFTTFVRLLVTSGLHDTQCGIKAFRGDVARVLFPLLRDPGFSGDVEALYIALKYNLAIRRVPVRLVYQGSTSVRPMRHGLDMGRHILAVRTNYAQGKYASPELAAIASQEYWNT
jgi:dolichyl-phosphate beta-glucosyltransferase